MNDRDELIALRRLSELEAKAANADPQQPAKQPRSWASVPGEALANLPKSAGNFVSGIYQSVRHPIDTGKALFEAGQGAAVNLMPDAYINQLNKLQPGLADKRRDVSEKADAIGGFYKDRYGSVEGFKEGIATDPVGIASDLSTVLTGGAMLAPKTSTVANVLNAGAKYTNPVNAVTGIAGKAGVALSDKVMKPVARRFMQSAVKPTIEQLRKGDAGVAIDTLLKYGINPSEKGVQSLRGRVDDINSQISGKIAASNATVNKSDVLSYLIDPTKRFSNQVSPTSDLNAISGVAQDFVNHPGFPGNTIPVQAAQALKQGTYKSLSGKYGEVGSASTEAQKALARGLKDQVGKAIPDVIPLNAEESNLLRTLKVTERRALMELNKNPVGLSALASNPVGFAAFMADRSSAFKALTARMINRTAAVPLTVGTGLLGTPSGAATSANLMSQAGLLDQRQR